MAKCITCNKEIEIKAWSKARKYCSNQCSMKNYSLRVGKMRTLNLPSSTVGTISELEVGLDLLRKGYEVYKPLTANCSGDLLAEKSMEFKKIEVRTGWRNQINQRVMYPTQNIRAPILAVFIAASKEIVYIGEQL